MTPLREAFIRELVLRGTAPRTQESYVAGVYRASCLPQSALSRLPGRCRPRLARPPRGLPVARPLLPSGLHPHSRPQSPHSTEPPSALEPALRRRQRHPAPVRSPTKVFRAKFCEGLQRPFAGPAQVLAYLSRYTHRVALSPRRLQQLDPEHHTVTFTYKDYADHDRVKPLTLSLAEFLRRFQLHLLPPRFVKIRHYGFLSNGQGQRRLAQARALWHAPVAVPEPALPSAAVPPTATGDHRPRCPHCGADALVLVEILYPPKTLRPEDTS